MKEILRILVNIVLFVSAFSVIYIAIYLFRIDLKNKQINAQLEEEKDNCKLQIYELNKRITKLEKENNDDRNNSAPRLTELCIAGEVEIIGKTKCEYTGKTVSVYQII